MFLVDSHAHLSGEEIFPSADELIKRAQEAGVHRIVNICTDLSSLERGKVLAAKYPNIALAAATHPHDVAEKGDKEFEMIATHARNKVLVAIGETGLDSFYNHSPIEVQDYFLRRYLKLALECRLPVVIHCRDAFKDLWKAVDACYLENGKHGPGILHCFTGSDCDAQEVLARGWYLSLSGIVTFKKSEALRQIVKTVPLERLLIETDTPFLAPQSHRGKPNEPSFLPEIAQTIASIKNLSLEEVAKATSANALTLLKF